MQKLILPINKTIVTAGYKNPAYENLIVNGTKIGTHYGVDIVGELTVYASGKGKVIDCGYDNVFGNYVVIQYNECYNHKTKQTQDVIIRYFHFDFIKCKKNQVVTKDSVIGIMGSTGKYVTGVHCHVEVDTDLKFWQYTPSLSGSSNIFKAGYRGSNDTTFNPMELFHVKTTYPDYQTINRVKDEYSTEKDINIPTIM